MGACTIRFAEYNDIPAIMSFINDHWKKNHILATNRKLFEWQYINNNRVCFVIGEDDNHNVQGILGFIPYNNGDKKDIALALWKAISTDFLGIRLLLYLMENESYNNIFCVGINMQTTSKIYSQVSMNVGCMKHWYRLNPDSPYYIAKIKDDYVPNIIDSNYSTHLFGTVAEFKDNVDFESISSMWSPFKSEQYFVKRYFNHPCYNYYVFGLKNKKEDIVAVFVVRLQEFNNSKAIRLVDYVGPESLLKEITSHIDKLMKTFNAEYTDMYEAGLNENTVYDAGWLLTEKTKNIIPNYFSPFVQQNIDIYYCVSDTSMVLFKGDGDQDRPN